MVPHQSSPSLAVQHSMLVRKLPGHFGYDCIIGKLRGAGPLKWEVRRTWRRWLGRHSQQGRMPWAEYERLLNHYHCRRRRWCTAPTLP